MHSHVRGPAHSLTSTALLTFCACTPPLEQVLHLWDFLLAFGVHMNVLCVIAQLFLIREDLLASSKCATVVRRPAHAAAR